MNEDILVTKPAEILCVDDEINVLRSLKRVFRAEKYTIHLAGSGAEGLELLRQHPIDLVISDMRMPQMDGAEFLSRVAENWPEVIRVLLTGYADIDSTIEAVNKGRIYSYCSKPWDDEQLKSVVKKGIEEKRLREERIKLFEIIEKQNQELKDLNNHLEDKVQIRTEQLRQSHKKLESAHSALQKQYSDSVRVFAKIIEMRPGIMAGHSTYIAKYARLIGLKLFLPDTAVKDLVYAGLLLQIGKMGLADSLMIQPFFRMSQKNRELFLRHALEGEALLMNMEELKEAARLIRHQFENYDGSGFPDGLAKEAIPVGARILTVVRDYLSYLEGSMTGKNMSVAYVQERLNHKKGNLYDPEIVDLFFQILEETQTDSERPVVEMSCAQLLPGMEVSEIYYEDRLYLKDFILDKKTIQDIIGLRDAAGHQTNAKLIIRIRLGEDGEEKRI